YPFQRIRSLKTFRDALIEKLPFIALSIASSILTVFAQKAGDALLSVQSVPLPTRVLVAAQSLIAYFGKMIFPVNLVPFYPYPAHVSLSSFEYLFSVLLVLGITIIPLVFRRKQKLWPAVWSYYAVTLIPVVGIVQVGAQAMADRYTYLPSIGPFLIAGLGAAWLIRRSGRMSGLGRTSKLLSAAAALFLLVSMSALTVRQIGIWKNNIDLWNYVIDREPRTYFAYNNRGTTLYAMGQLDRAIEDYEKAIALYPAYPKGHYNLGLALFEKGLLEQAIGEYEIAVRLEPRNVDAHLNLGIAYAKKGLRDKSIEEYRTVERLSAGSAEPYYQLGSFFSNRGLVAEATELLEIAVRIKPDFADAQSNLAAALFREGRVADALEHYLVYSRLRPDDPAAYLNLGSAYAASGFLDSAIEQFQIAVRLNPAFADAHYNLGLAYQAKGLMDQAVGHLEAAARLNPADAAIRNDLVKVYRLRNSSGRP
ncbi:MAG: tetratricopeptide repeat protein, partial [Nitrospirae bacterium]|nr:tetratricopeptide repeat protein [Nitrospirota bacterium]